mgnify:CR=1 FL=1
METGEPIVQRIVVREELHVPRVVIQQGVHAGDERTGHFHIEEEIHWYREDVNYEVIQCGFVCHYLVLDEDEVNRNEPDYEQIDEYIVER